MLLQFLLGDLTLMAGLATRVFTACEAVRVSCPHTNKSASLPWCHQICNRLALCRPALCRPATIYTCRLRLDEKATCVAV